MDLDELEQLAKRVAEPDEATKREGHGWAVSEEFRAAANPETVLALVRVARAASKYIWEEQYGSGEASWTAERDMIEAVRALKEPSK